MTVALLLSAMRASPSCSTAHSLLRRSPPPLPSVVEEASSNCAACDAPQQAAMPGAARTHGGSGRPPSSDASRRSSRSSRRRGRACSRHRPHRRSTRLRRRVRREPECRAAAAPWRPGSPRREIARRDRRRAHVSPRSRRQSARAPEIGRVPKASATPLHAQTSVAPPLSADAWRTPFWDSRSDMF